MHSSQTVRTASLKVPGIDTAATVNASAPCLPINRSTTLEEKQQAGWQVTRSSDAGWLVYNEQSLRLPVTHGRNHKKTPRLSFDVWANTLSFAAVQQSERKTKNKTKACRVLKPQKNRMQRWSKTRKNACVTILLERNGSFGSELRIISKSNLTVSLSDMFPLPPRR